MSPGQEHTGLRGRVRLAGVLGAAGLESAAAAVVAAAAAGSVLS